MLRLLTTTTVGVTSDDRAGTRSLSVDPLTFGNVQETFARFIRNETVVFVRAASDQEAEFAADTLRQYSPITIYVLSLPKLELSNPIPNRI